MNAEEVYTSLNKKIKKGGITDDKIKQIVEQHFEENPVQVITDNTLSVAGIPADIERIDAQVTYTAMMTNTLLTKE